MGSADTITLNPSLVQKIQNYMNDPVYKETVENAASYNSRLSSERTMRLPFLDSQTGVAQNHSNLFMEARQRLPGLREGQIYSYPSKRWRKKRRQYLINFMQPRYPTRVETKEEEISTIAAETSPFPAPPPPVGFSEDSKDSTKEETKPEWYYDELEMPDVGEFEDPDPDSDYDYEEYSSSRRKKKKPPVKAPRTPGSRGRRKITYDAVTDPDKPFACDICGARYKTRPGLTYHYTHSHKDKEDNEEDDEMVPSSPKRDDSSGKRRGSGPASSLPPPVLHPQQLPSTTGGLHPPTLQPQQLPPPPPHMQNPAVSSAGILMPPPPHMMHGHHPPPPHLIPQQQPPPHHGGGGPLPNPYGGPPQPQMHQQQQPPPPPHHQVPPPMPPHHPQMPPTSHFQQHPQHPGPPPVSVSAPLPPTVTPSPSVVPPTMGGGGSQHPPVHHESSNGGGEKRGPPDMLKPRVQPSPYCDFCLGDATENKKSGGPEEMVSCSDCGRSGHPSCLQFTANMIISVKKYRWQCIECKCCSICGTSDNDDQLLFCDDCDRGYHMYCLSPPLDAPPEGSWSCTLCLAEFHQNSR